MSLLSIVAAAALTAPPVFPAFVPASPAPIIITSDNVDLDGAGSMDFKPDEKAFHADPPAGGDGNTVVVRLWVNPQGRPLSCDVGQSDLPQVASTGCAQLMKSARFQLFPGFALPLHRGFVDVHFSFFRDPPGRPKGEVMYARDNPGYVNTDIVYPPSDVPAGQVIHNDDGAFSVPISQGDYPVVAIRYGMESRSLSLLGIGRDGKVKTCRPMGHPSASNTAFLDNYTCDIFVRRGHFAFLPSAASYDGLRYRVQSMSWKMPQ